MIPMIYSLFQARIDLRGDINKRSPCGHIKSEFFSVAPSVFLLMTVVVGGIR